MVSDSHKEAPSPSGRGLPDQAGDGAGLVGEPPGSRAYHGDPGDAPDAQAGADAGEPPGSASYYGESDRPGLAVGEAPGSPAYYGESGGSPGGEEGGEGAGEPPGSPAYHGRAATGAAGLEGDPELPLPTVGVAPGSSGYYGSEPPAPAGEHAGGGRGATGGYGGLRA